MYLQKLIYSKSCEHRSWGLVAFITTLMGCSESIFVDKSIIDFPIFLLFFNTKFPIFSILNFLFSYFFEQPCRWTPCRILAAFPISNLKLVAKAIKKVVAFKTCQFISDSNSEELHVYRLQAQSWTNQQGPGLWTSEMQGAQHMISMKKQGTQEQKLGATGHQALLDHSPDQSLWWHH